MRNERKGRIKDDSTFLSGDQMDGAFRNKELRELSLFSVFLFSASVSNL